MHSRSQSLNSVTNTVALPEHCCSGTQVSRNRLELSVDTSSVVFVRACNEARPARWRDERPSAYEACHLAS